MITFLEYITNFLGDVLMFELIPGITLFVLFFYSFMLILFYFLVSRRV